MTLHEQQRILEALVARGWIDPGEIPRGAEALVDKVDLLVRRGLVDAAQVRSIAEELARGAPPDAIPITEAASEGAKAIASDLEALPADLRRWDRYAIERRIGRGGSGIVYAARDPRLGRRVAVKVLTTGGDRAIREAKLQARVDHEGVCEVYEVGWVGDRPFVAMRLVDGETLQRAAPRMTREAIVTAVRDAARAVHAAHRLGLVHRDLKPGNVMVEPAEDGASRTFVLDFGIAKEVDGGGSTATGHLLGTPSFMAPEQARGDARRIDRRTDVYGLGATLYASLCGAPPFPGEAIVALQALLSDEEAPRLRARDPSIPRDLETIAAACLEKDPARRYATAAALADDLDRYLAGEPIAARRSGLVARAARWAARHRAIAITSAAGLATTIALTIGWARSFAAGREEAAIARRLGEEAMAMESALRIAYLSPLHDTRGDRAAIEARFPWIEREAAGRGPTARAAGAYAVGRGLFWLHRYDEARERLETAWNEGDRSPALALALARTLGALHESRLDAARRIPDPEVRAARIKALSDELITPALAYLAVARDGEGAARSLAFGWIALYEGRLDEALERAREAAAGAPWLHEAITLEGAAHKRRAEALEDEGKLAESLAAYERAAGAYERSGEIARSDVEVHAAACRTYLRMASLESDAMLQALDLSRFDRGILACDRAIAADGGDPDPLEDKAHLLEIRGADALAYGGDPSEWLAAGIALAEDVALVFPDRAEAFATLGAGLWVQATFEVKAGLDPRVTLARGVDACERATELDPAHSQAHNYLGVMNMSLAEDCARRGADPRPFAARAIAGYEAAARLDPTFAGVWNNIGRARSLMAEHEIDHGLPARASLDEATKAFATVLRALPEHPSVHNNAAYVWHLEARLAARSGADPRPAIERALDGYRRARELSPSYAFAFKNAGDTLLLAAAHALAKARDPAPDIERALASYDDAVRANPKYAGAYRGMARAHALAARALRARPLDASRALDRALAALAKAEAIAPSDPDLIAARAEVEAARDEPPPRP